MKRIYKNILLFIVFFITLSIPFIYHPQLSLAAACAGTTVSAKIPDYGTGTPTITELPPDFTGTITIKATTGCYVVGQPYSYVLYPEGWSDKKCQNNWGCTLPSGSVSTTDKNSITISNASLANDDPTPPCPKGGPSFNPDCATTQNIGGASHPGKWYVEIFLGQGSDWSNSNAVISQTAITVSASSQPTPTPFLIPGELPPLPEINIDQQKLGDQCGFQSGAPIKIDVIGNVYPGIDYKWWWDGDKSNHDVATAQTGQTGITFTIDGKDTIKPLGLETICVDADNPGLPVISRGCKGQVNSINLYLTAGPPNNSEKSCDLVNAPRQQSGPTPIPPSPPCSQWEDIKGNKLNNAEVDNINNTIKCSQVNTAIGAIDTDPIEFIKSLMTILLSLSGGVAVIMLILAGYKLMMSSGNPEKVKEAQESITSAIVGLLFIIFSLVILQFIGVNILHLPGFTP